MSQKKKRIDKRKKEQQNIFNEIDRFAEKCLIKDDPESNIYYLMTGKCIFLLL